MADSKLSQELRKLKSDFGPRWEDPSSQRRNHSPTTPSPAGNPRTAPSTPTPRDSPARRLGKTATPSPAPHQRSRSRATPIETHRPQDRATRESQSAQSDEESTAAKPGRTRRQDSPMASQRSRNARGPNRNGSGQGEEVQLWQQIKDELRATVDRINTSNDSARQIIAQESFISKNKTTVNVETEERKLEELFRSSIRGTENVVSQIEEVKSKLEILSALQKAKESEAQNTVPAGSSRTGGLLAGSGRNPSRVREREREKDPASLYEFDGAGDSPVPSPIGGHTRKLGGSSGGTASDRSGNRDSVPPRGADHDTPAKADSVEPMLPGAGPASAAARSKVIFNKGQDVAFKPKPTTSNESTDWYLGKVQQVSGEGKSRRYKVKDEDPDLPPEQRQEYRTSASSMIPIPPAGAELPELDKGKTVLALYPDSTTFYKAEVMGTDAATGKVNLRFEGEENSGTLQVVERRYVVEYRS